MVITKLCLETLKETSILLQEDIKPIDELEMYKYLKSGKYSNYLYINWDKHLFSKDLGEIIGK